MVVLRIGSRLIIAGSYSGELRMILNVKIIVLTISVSDDFTKRSTI
ncbi:MAG: hypothetical protein LBF32_03335 [Streptococcaceae bacterium]|nr:hypothetical protein [Streptococcaceae bacterium]